MDTVNYASRERRQSADIRTEYYPSAAGLSIFFLATLIPSHQLNTILTVTYNARIKMTDL